MKGKRARALRAKHSDALNGPRPNFVAELSWRMFLGYVREGRSLQDISRESGLSAYKVGAIISHIDRQLEAVRNPRGAPNIVTVDSPLEDLAVSIRTRNALHVIGCVTIGDILEKDFTRAVRRFGPVTRRELTQVLKQHGLAVPPTLRDVSPALISELRRELARLRDSMEHTIRRLGTNFDRLEHRLNKL